MFSSGLATNRRASVYTNKPAAYLNWLPPLLLLPQAQTHSIIAHKNSFHEWLFTARIESGGKSKLSNKPPVFSMRFDRPFGANSAARGRFLKHRHGIQCLNFLIGILVSQTLSILNTLEAGFETFKISLRFLTFEWVYNLDHATRPNFFLFKESASTRTLCK